MDTRKSRAVIRIVDDDKGVRDSYKYLIEGEGWLVRTYSSAEDFLEHDDPTIQGCGVFDVRMPGISGLELQSKLAQRSAIIAGIPLRRHGAGKRHFIADVELVDGAGQSHVDRRMALRNHGRGACHRCRDDAAVGNVDLRDHARNVINRMECVIPGGIVWDVSYGDDGGRDRVAAADALGRHDCGTGFNRRPQAL